MHALDRALLALSMSCSEAGAATLPDWVLGRRNQALIDLHCSLFGPALEAWAVCQSCGEKMEFKVNAKALVQSMSAEDAEQNVFFKGQTFRLPTSRDLVGAVQQGDPESAAFSIVERCMTDAAAPVQWSREDVEEIGEKMAMADPLAEIRLALICPACSNETTETIEVTSFLWSEIESRAKRLLWEVHAIASAYGWSEAQVLSLSPARRALYVEMAQA